MRQTLRSTVLRLGRGNSNRGQRIIRQRQWYCSVGDEGGKQVESSSPPPPVQEPNSKEVAAKRSNVEEAFQLPAETLVEAYTTGKYKVEEVIEQCIKKLQTDGALYNSVVSVNLRSIYTAAALDESFAKTGKTCGPLHGVPFLVGDAIHVAGMPTTCGSSKVSYVPSKTAPVVEALIAAGAICVGKANQDEFGLGYLGHNESTGTILNPLNPKHYAGGSQGGAAVSVATNCVPFAIGIDMVGDIRIPSAFCNVIGFVPEVGAYSTSRTWSLSSTLGSVGIVARSVDDIKIIDGVMRASNVSPDSDVRALLAAKPQEPIIPVETVRVLVPEEGFIAGLDTDMESAFRISLMAIQMMKGHVSTSIKMSNGMMNQTQLTLITEAPQGDRSCKLNGLFRKWWNTLPAFNYEAAGRIIAICEKTGVNHQEVVDSISLEYAKNRLNAEMMFSEDLQKAEESIESIRQSVLDYWDEAGKSVEAMIFPTTVCASPTVVGADVKNGTIQWRGVHTGMEKLTSNTGPVSLTGLPSITVPLARMDKPSKTGIGLLVVGRPGNSTDKLLEVARAIDVKLKTAAVNLMMSGGTERETLVPGSEDWLEDPTKNSYVDWVANKLAIGRESEYRQKMIMKMKTLNQTDLVGEKAMQNHTTKLSLKPYSSAIHPPIEYPESGSHNVWKDHTPGVDEEYKSYEDERTAILESINRKPDPNRKLKELEEEEEIIRPKDEVPPAVAALGGLPIPEGGLRELKKLHKLSQKIEYHNPVKPQKKRV